MNIICGRFRTIADYDFQTFHRSIFKNSTSKKVIIFSKLNMNPHGLIESPPYTDMHNRVALFDAGNAFFLLLETLLRNINIENKIYL